MHVRPHVYAAAFACLSLLVLIPAGAPAPPARGLLAGKIVHADALLATRLPGVAPRAPVCSAASPHGDFALVAVLARPRGAKPGMTGAAYRNLIAAANGLVYEQAEESGAPGADLVFACDAAGAVRVDEVTLPTPLAKTTFDSVVADLGALGYKRTNEKYVVWFNGRPPGQACGTADLVSDGEPGDENRVASGPDWAVSFGCNSILHETMHVLGATGFTAPHGTGAGHCWDGTSATDVMCYDDGGPSIPASGLSNRCPTRALHLDCGHNDYFAAGPVPASSYLASHWNVAGCYNRFLVDYGCPGIDQPGAPPPTLRIVSRRRPGAATVRITFRLTGASAPASIAYTTPSGSGRLAFPPGRLTASLDLRASPGARVGLSDPRGLWLRDAVVTLP